MSAPGKNPQLAENLSFRCCRTEVEVYRCGHSAEFPMQCHRVIGPADLFRFHTVTHRLRTDVARVCDNCLGDYFTMEYQHEAPDPIIPASNSYPPVPTGLGSNYPQTSPVGVYNPYPTGPGLQYSNPPFAARAPGFGSPYPNPYLSGGAHQPNVPLTGRTPSTVPHYPNAGRVPDTGPQYTNAFVPREYHPIATVNSAARQSAAPAARAASANAPETSAQPPREGRQTVIATVESDESSLSTPPDSSPERRVASNMQSPDGRPTWRKVRADMRDVKMQKELADRPPRLRRAKGE